MLLIFFLSLLVSFLLSVVLIRFQHLHSRYSADFDLSGIQKFHPKPVPRIGGGPIFLGILVGCLLAYASYRSTLGMLTLLVATPAWFAGMAEDLTKKIGVRTRLMATFVSALLGSLLLGATLTRLDLPIIDELLNIYPWVAIVFTMISVGGVAHSINIIDGYNGLSGMVVSLALLALGYVAFKVNDFAVLSVCCASCGAVVGFLLLNYPRGKIFAGDGGAYLAGVFVAEIAVLLVGRNPQVSPWFPLLVVIYPVFETIFSIYRRKFLLDRSVGHPDALHLHSVVYRRLVRWMVGSKEAQHLIRRNSMTAPYLWVLAAISIVPAMIFWRHTGVLILCSLLFILLYIHLYWMIIRFKSPRWLVVRKRAARPRR